MGSKIKHLEFIQAAIARMANHSFLMKGWSITVFGAIIALSFKESDSIYLGIAVITTVFFWLSDAYYLRHEKSFRELFDVVRKKDEAEIDFNMHPRQGSKVSLVSSVRSNALLLFYGCLLLILGFIAISMNPQIFY